MDTGTSPALIKISGISTESTSSKDWSGETAELNDYVPRGTVTLESLNGGVWTPPNLTEMMAKASPS